MLTFLLIVVIVGSVITIAMCLHNYRNPRKVWDGQHGSEMKGGEPTEEALAKIQRNAVLAMIFVPILMTITAVVGYLKFEQDDRVGRGLNLQTERDQRKKWGPLAKVNVGMAVDEMHAVTGPGNKKSQPDGEYLWWRLPRDTTDDRDRQVYVWIKDGKVAGKSWRSGSNWMLNQMPFEPRNADGKTPRTEVTTAKEAPDDRKNPAADHPAVFLPKRGELAPETAKGTTAKKEPASQLKGIMGFNPDGTPVRTEHFVDPPIPGLPGPKKGLTAEMIKAELKKFEGTWKAVSIVIDGKPYPEGELKKDIWLQDADGNFEVVSEGRIVNKGKTTEIDPTQSPALVKGEDDEGKYHGIYRLMVDTVEMCTGKADKPRPTEFASKPGSGHWHEVWKRVSTVRQTDLILAGKPPMAERVARRAMVLTLVMYRASLEQFAGAKKYEALHAKLPGWIEKLELGSELEKEEHDFLRAALGRADARMRNNASWRTEGLAVLQWALKRFELGAHDEFVDARKLGDGIGFSEQRLAATDTAAAQKLIRDAKLRPAVELDRMRTRVTIIHWRLRQYRLSPGGMDYFGYLKAHPSFKKTWLEGLPLLDGELVIDKKAIADADKEKVRECESIAVERQIAVYWLAGDHAIYSKIDPATILTGLP